MSEPESQTTRRCRTCGIDRPLSEFFRSKREASGVEYQCKKCASTRQKDQRTKLWKQILEHYGPKCFCCGVTTEEFLQLDHVSGGGADHKRQVNRGRIYADIVKKGFPKGYRIACANCNFSLGIRGYCPHQKGR